MKLRTKIYSSYFLTMLILLVALLVTTWKVNNSQEVAHRISLLRMPTFDANSTVYTGLHRSLSSLRSWVLLGEEQFKHERNLIWKKEIIPSLNTLTTLSKDWTNPEYTQHLEKTSTLLVQLETYQQEIEDIAHTPANKPSVDLLFNQALPLTADLYENISIIIDLEQKQAAGTERKKLFKNLADTRGSLALMLASIRSYVMSGDNQFKIKTIELWDKNTLSFNSLQKNVALFTSKQQTVFNLFVNLRNQFELLFPKILTMRADKKWVLSHYWLATKVVPLSDEIDQLMQQMKEDHIQLLKKDEKKIDNNLNRLIVIEWVLLLLGILTSAITGWRLSKNIAEQVGGEPSDIMAFAEQAAEGNIDIQTKTKNRTGILASLDRIAISQKHIADQANAIADGNYTTNITPRSDVDTLGIAMQQMAKNLREVSEVAGAVANDDLTRRIKAKSKNDLLALAMNKMIDNLSVSNDENRKRTWLQEGQVKIATILREENDIQSLGEAFLKTISEYVNAQLGAVYQWLEATESEAAALELTATYAYTRRKQINKKFKLGEGLVGQAGKENKVIIVEELPDDYIQIRSSLGETPPRNLILVPFDYRGKLCGVLELGFVQEIDESIQALLSNIRESLGAAFENIVAQNRLATQLQETKTLADEIGINEQRTTAIIESSLSAMITISTRGIIESCNQMTETLFGYSKGEMVGQNVKMLMPETIAVEHDGYLANYLKTGLAKIIGSGRELVARTKEGKEFHIHLSVSEMKLGDSISFLGTISDITEQVTIRDKSSALLENLSISEKRTTAIIESSLSAMITISTRGIIESCNQMTETLFGYSKEEMVDQNVKMLMPEAIAVEHDGYLENYLKTGFAKIIGSGRELVAKTKAGVEFHIHLSVSEMKLGDTISFLGTITDITEQVTIREEANALLENLSISEERTTTILESSLAGIITINPRGIIESCNKTTEALFGYSKEEMIGNNVKMLMPEQRAKEHDGYLQNYQQTGLAKVIGIGREVVGKRKDGSEFHLHLSVVEMELGDTLSYLGTIMDITEQVAQREAINKSNMELQASTEELATQKEELKQTNKHLTVKTDELEKQKKDLHVTQQGLEQKAKELEESNRYKSEFLANMSHELRTPLNSLLILAKFLADNDEQHLSVDEVESATIIYESGNNLLQLINDILDLSKVEAGHMNIHSDAISVADLQHFMNSRFKHMAEAKNIVFKMDLQANMPLHFISDYTKVGQILTNLVSNALKFTETGSVTLKMALDEIEFSQWLSFTVIDTGIGIPLEKQRAVFEAFQQADGSTNRKFAGTGLGLSIALSFAKLLGGTINLKSTEGKGSQFSFSIPYVEPSDDQEVDLELSKIISQKLEPLQIELKDTAPSFEDDRDQLDPQKPLFLVIEDDPIFAKNLMKISHEQNSQVLHAPDGETGLNLAKKYNLTGIFLDYILPGLDGGDVLAALRSDVNTRHIPVHVISAVDDLFNMSQLGASGQSTKPVSKNQIVSILEYLRKAHDLKEISLLIVEDDVTAHSALQKLLSKEPVNISIAKTGEEALKYLQKQTFSSMILDLGLPDMTGTELLKTLSKDNKIVMPPVIIYSGKELSDEENQQLQEFTSSIIIKSVRSPERLLDEIHVFIDQLSDGQNKQVSFSSLLPADLENLKGKQILLVDDDMRNTFSLAKVLRSKGLEVRIAPSGQDGLNVLAEQAGFDLVLMDIMMPGMDGYEAMQKIRAQEAFKDLPIIALTANAMQGDKEKCISAGANDYQAKPVDVEKLLIKIQMWL